MACGNYHTPQPNPLASDPFIILSLLHDDMNMLQITIHKPYKHTYAYTYIHCGLTLNPPMCTGLTIGGGSTDVYRRVGIEFKYVDPPQRRHINPIGHFIRFIKLLLWVPHLLVHQLTGFKRMIGGSNLNS